MANIALNIICSLAGLFGGFILVYVLVALGQGFFASLDPATIALKVGTTIIRAGFLLACAWAAWRRPHQASWFAAGALLAFAFGGAADEIFKHGLVSGLSRLVPTYYRTVGLHALLAVAAWLLAFKAKQPAVGA
jgi:hypothetical protein